MALRQKLRVTWKHLRRRLAGDKRGKVGFFSRNRGLDFLLALFAPEADPIAVVDAAIARGARPARILEIGFGQGRVLLELQARFPDAEVHGVNRWPSMLVTGSDSLRKVASHAGLPVPARDRPFPHVHFFDAAGMEFEDATFDLIVSQVAIPYVDKKDDLLREAWRVLRKGGVALLNVDVRHDPVPDFLRLETPRFVVYRGDAIVPLSQVLASVAAKGFDVSCWQHVTRGGKDGREKRWTHVKLVKNRDEPLPLDLAHDAKSSFNLKKLKKIDKPSRVYWGHRSVFRWNA